MKKRILALCLVVVFAMSMFAGCGSKNSWNEIQKRGKLIVGTSADYPPHEFVQDGEYMGFEMDLIREMGDRLGLEVEIVDMGFDTLIAALKQGKIDCVIACMNATEERLEQADFSDIYFKDIHGVVTQAGSGIILSDEFDMANYTVGVQSGTNHETWLMENLVGPGLMEEGQIFRFEKTDMGILDAASGRIDLYLTELPIARSFMRDNPDIEIIHEFDLSPDDGGVRIAVQKGQDDFIDVINQQLREMTADGFISDLADQWLA